MSKKNRLKKRRTRRHATISNNSNNIDISEAGDRHRTSLLRFGRVVNRVLPRRKWPSFAKPFQNIHPQIDATRDSPKEVMRVVSQSHSYSDVHDRRTRKQRKATPKMHIGLAPSARVSATTTMDTLLKVCLTLGLWHIVRQFDLVSNTSVYTESLDNGQIRKEKKNIAFEKYCNSNLTDALTAQFDEFYNTIPIFTGKHNIQLIFIGNKISFNIFAAYLQKYQHSNNSVEQHYVCYPTDKNNCGTSDDNHTHNTNGMGRFANTLKLLYGIQCVDDFNSEESIDIEKVIEYIKNSFKKLIKKCGNKNSRVFHIGSLANSGYLEVDYLRKRIPQSNFNDPLSGRVCSYFGSLNNKIQIVKNV